MNTERVFFTRLPSQTLSKKLLSIEYAGGGRGGPPISATSIPNGWNNLEIRMQYLDFSENTGKLYWDVLGFNFSHTVATLNK